MSPWRPTLAFALGAALVGLLALLAGLFTLFAWGARRSLDGAAEQAMRQASARVAEAVEGHLAEAEQVVEAFEAGLDGGLLRVDEPQKAAEALVGELVGRPAVSALSLTGGRDDGVYQSDEEGHEAGDARLQPEGRWQVTVSRGREGPEVFVVTCAAAGCERRQPGSTRVAKVEDPTVHPTFVSPSRREWRGRLLWSDLSFAEGGGLEGAARRRVVTVQKSLEGVRGSVVVLRVSLDSERIDQLTQVGLEPRGGLRPTVFLADVHGHLLSRTAPADRVEEIPGDEVRVVPAALSPALADALGSPLLRGVAPGEARVMPLETGGVAFLLGVSALPEGRTQGWRVGTLVPEAYFLGELEGAVRRTLWAALGLSVAAVLLGALAVRGIRRELGGLIHEARRLSHFDFGPRVAPPPVLEDVREAWDSLEQAKTALRALGKYAPLDLVRSLYLAKVEPQLGGRVEDVTVLFTDIEGFTTLSETMPVDALAEALGRYLEVMTGAIHQSGGIIDKLTGDGVMALWNVPTPLEGHPARACEGVLSAVKALERLFDGPGWAGLPRWRTRFGLHRARVSVGHFGAPDRMSYTAMGDGVNLASRLEGLNKQYRTQVVVSEALARGAGDAFAFRRLDRVAVKGRRGGVEVLELLGPSGGPPSIRVARYEAALEDYFAGRFEAAVRRLEGAEDDAPSQVLLARCRRLLDAPPGQAGWDGVWVALEK